MTLRLRVAEQAQPNQHETLQVDDGIPLNRRAGVSRSRSGHVAAGEASFDVNIPLGDVASGW